jgi:hypothetical protein
MPDSPIKDPVAALLAAREPASPNKKRVHIKKDPSAIGRPKQDYRMSLAELHRLAADHTPNALNTLANIMLTGRDGDRIKCAEILLARAWGNPVTPIEHGGTIEVAAGAREKLAAILERIGVGGALVGKGIVESSLVEAEFTEVVQKPVTTKEIKSEQVLGPPPRGPNDE